MNNMVEQQEFYVVQQLTLPSPRVYVIKTLDILGKSSGMNSPEILSRYQKSVPYKSSRPLYL